MPLVVTWAYGWDIYLKWQDGFRGDWSLFWSASVNASATIPLDPFENAAMHYCKTYPKKPPWFAAISTEKGLVAIPCVWRGGKPI